MSPYQGQSQMVWHNNKKQWLYELQRCLVCDKELSELWMKQIQSYIPVDASNLHVSAVKYYGLNRPIFVHKERVDTINSMSLRL